MANVNLKTDFKDGEFLYADQLKNNFEAIQAALNAMNAIVWQDNADKVVTFRGTTEELMNREIINGQILYDTNTGESYIDYLGKRISTGSGNAIHIGDTEPTNPSTQIWINRNDLSAVGSEVVNSLDGNEERMAPSVAAVNKGLVNLKSEIVESGFNEEKKVFYVKWDDGTMVQFFGKSVTASEARMAGGLTYYSGSEFVDLAIPFVDTNYRTSTNVIIANMNYFCQAYVAPVSNSQVQVSFASTGQNESRTVDVILIGRWK